MTALERHIKDAEIQMIDLVKANFSVLLEKIRASTTFLDEMNATNATNAPGEVGEYVATMIVTPPPAELPNLDDKGTLVEEIEKAKTGIPTPEKPQFQQDLNWELVTVDDERYAKYVTWLITKPVSEEMLQNAQTKQKLRFDPKAHDHLHNLIWYRAELMKGKEGAFTLKEIKSQADTTEAEKVLWEALGKTIKQ